jgi:hypothetical protein
LNIPLIKPQSEPHFTSSHKKHQKHNYSIIKAFASQKTHKLKAKKNKTNINKRNVNQKVI